MSMEYTKKNMKKLKQLETQLKSTYKKWQDYAADTSQVESAAMKDAQRAIASFQLLHCFLKGL